MSQKERDAFVAFVQSDPCFDELQAFCMRTDAEKYGRLSPVRFAEIIVDLLKSRAEAVALRRYPDETPDSAWLVELSLPVDHAWWDGAGFTIDAWKARRFATREEAVQAARSFHRAHATEHVFLKPDETPDEDEFGPVTEAELDAARGPIYGMDRMTAGDILRETPAPAGPIGVAPCTCIRNVHCSVHGEEKPAPPEAARRCTRCGEVVKATDLSKQGGKWYHPGHQKAKGERWILWCGPVMEDPSAGGGK